MHHTHTVDIGFLQKKCRQFKRQFQFNLQTKTANFDKLFANRTLGSGHYFGFVKTKIGTRRDIAKIQLPAERYHVREVFKNILSTKQAFCEKLHKKIKNA